ncbi:hypothetical protein L484_025532 [Morus notabilis]|uniref:Uncharacterized protein n=1 Tax=Morus notabilis TaxID=981085 RepID=W9SDF2_9ROSA|nr:hypothetical protein L484_025532 [Morus notabilis]
MWVKNYALLQLLSAYINRDDQPLRLKLPARNGEDRDNPFGAGRSQVKRSGNCKLFKYATLIQLWFGIIYSAFAFCSGQKVEKIRIFETSVLFKQ